MPQWSRWGCQWRVGQRVQHVHSVGQRFLWSQRKLSTASARGEMRARQWYLLVGAWPQVSAQELPTLFVPPLISAIRRGPIIYAQRKLQQLCSLVLEISCWACVMLVERTIYVVLS